MSSDRRPWLYPVLLVIFPFSISLACADDPEIIIIADDDSSIEDNQYQEDTGFADTPPEEEDFRKPPPSVTGRLEPYSCNGSCDTDSYGFATGAAGRPHMAPTPRVLESWLFPGEYFVMDRYIMAENRLWMPVDYHLMVLHEGQPLPFRVYLVDGHEFPSMEEIESWGPQEFTLVDSVHRQHNTPINYTIVIPPWAFPDRGAYNVQVLFYPEWEPIPEAPFLAMKVIKVGPITDEPHSSHTIYYGSESFDDPPQDLRNRTDEAVKWQSPNAGRFVGQVNHMFLAPPTEVYDWEVFETAYDGSLAEVFEISEPTITLDFFTSGVSWETLQTHTIGTNLYYLLRDNEVIDSFLLDPGYVSYEDLMNFEDDGVVLPIEVELSEETQAFQLMAVPWPFERQRPEPDIHVTRDGNNPAGSNTLLLKYVPD